MYTVYVIQSRSGKRYTGYTGNLERRLQEHNSGKCKTTKSSTGWQVIYRESFDSRSEAMSRERWLKSGKGRDFLRSLISKAL